MNRIVIAAREGIQSARRVWVAYGQAEGRARNQRIRLAAMTDGELLRASTKWSGAVCSAEIARRGLS